MSKFFVVSSETTVSRGWLLLLTVPFAIVAFRGFDRLQAVAVGACIAFGLYTWSKRSAVSPFLVLFGFSIPFLIAVGDHVIHFMPPHPDAENYDVWGWTVRQSFVTGDAPEIGSPRLRAKAYSYYVGVVYLVTGRNSLLLAVVNAGLWGGTVLYWMRIARSLGYRVASLRDCHFAAYVGVLLPFFPASLSFMSANLREPIAVFCLTVTCWSFLAWTRYRRTRYLFQCVFASLPVALVRPEVFAVVVAVGAFAFFVALVRSGRQVLKPLAALSIAGLMFVSYLTSVYHIFDIGWLEAKRAAHAGGPKGYLEGLMYTSWVDVLQYAPIRAAYLLSAPFPWEPENYVSFITTTDSLFILGIIPPAIVGAAYAARDWTFEQFVFLAGVAVTTVVGYGIVVSSAGVTARRRLYAVPILLVFVAYLLSRFVNIEIEGPDE